MAWPLFLGFALLAVLPQLAGVVSWASRLGRIQPLVSGSVAAGAFTVAALGVVAEPQLLHLGQGLVADASGPTGFVGEVGISGGLLLAGIVGHAVLAAGFCMVVGRRGR